MARNRILAGTSPGTVVVFVGKKRMWVMGSPVARLNRGTLDPKEISEGVHEPLLKALYQEAKHKGRPVNRVTVFSVPSLPPRTIKLLTDTARASKLGRVMVLPWDLVTAGHCRTRRRKPPEKSPATVKEPRLSARFPVVVRATSRMIRINGRLALTLDNGRFIRGSAHRPKHPFETLRRLLAARLAGLPVSRWRLMVVVTPSVADSVVRTILTAAGRAGIAKFKLERQLEP